MNPVVKKITLTELTNTFVPFALLMIAALLVPETKQSVVYYRVVYSIWLTILFMIPALALFFLPGDPDRKKSYWLLCWTFGYVAFLVHFYYAIGYVFHGSIREVYAQQGPVIATSNFIDLIWWGLDLILAWFVASETRWIRVQRTGIHLYLPLTFFVSAVVIKHGFVRGLGILMTAAVVLSLLIRLLKQKRSAQLATGAA